MITNKIIKIWLPAKDYSRTDSLFFILIAFQRPE